MLSLNAKNKTLLFVIILMTLFALLFTAVLYWHKKQELQQAEKTYLENVNVTYIKILKKQNDFYLARARANLSSEGVKESLIASDKKKLYELTKGRWKTLKSSNKFLIQMNFYSKNAQLLLRMDDPNAMNGFTTPYITKSIKCNEPFFGFVLNHNRLEYHAIIPVFTKNGVVGALEFVTKPDEIFSEMEYINELKGALFVKNSLQNSKDIYGYKLQYNALGSIKIQEEMKKNHYRFEPFKHCEFYGKHYAVYSFDVNDFVGKSVAKAVFVNDITKINHDFYVDLIEMIVILISLLIMLIFVIHIGFQKIIEKLDEALNESNRAHSKLLDYVDLIDKNVITSTTDLNGTILSASKAFCDISGYTKEELIGANHRIVRHPDMPASLYEDMWETITNNQIWQGEMKNRTKSGGYYWILNTIYPNFDVSGEKIGYTAIRHDITDKKRVEELSITDGLTSIYNRRYFDQIFPKFINSAKRNNDLICFYMIDVDYFKLYNDTYGHQAGDDVLIKIADLMRQALKRSDDYCFRLGGEEFGILLRVSDEGTLCEFGEQLRNAVEALAIENKESPIGKYVTISIGQYCDLGINIQNGSVLYKNSDDLLYEAKQDGRNRVKCNRMK